MSIDVASLVFEIDSTQAVTARQRLEDLEKAGDRVDAMARKVRTATDRLNDSHRGATATAASATQGATSLAEAHGAVERAVRKAEQTATRAAEREAAAWAKVEAQLDKRNSAYRGAQALAAMKDEAVAASNLERRIDALMNSVDPTRAAQARLNAEMAEAAALYKAGAISASDYARATSVLDQRLANAARGQIAFSSAAGKAAASSKVATQAGLNFSRQMADIAVTGAMGMNPLMILIQQGPQIADIFAQAKSQGMGFSAVLGTLQAQMAPIVALLTPIALVAGAAAAGFALLHRELSKGYPKDITEGLDLTEEQLDRVKHKTVTMGDTFMATVEVMGRYLSSGPLGDALDAVNRSWNAWLDDLTKNTVTEVATIVGVFTGAYKFIIENWRNFPAAFGSLFAMGVNIALEAVERLVNGAVKGLNSIFAVMRLAPQWSWLPNLQEVDLDGFKMQVSGAAEFMGKAFKASVTDEIARATKGMERLGKEIGSAAEKRAADRALKEAKDPNKSSAGRKGPADRSDERLAQYEAALAAARAEELQAQLALVEDTKARAALEKEILDVQLVEKRADLDRQAAKVEADVAAQRITEVTGDLLLMEIEALKLSAARVAALREEKINRDAARQATRDDYDIRAAGIQDQIDLLESQKATAKFAFQRRAIDREILEHQQRIERLKLEEIIATTASTSAEYKIAEARLKVLDLIQANERKAAEQTPDQVFGELSSTLQGVIDAFQRQDWEKAVTGLIEAFGKLKDTFTRSGVSLESKIGSIAGVGGVIGGVVGGKAGSTISGAASGAMAGLTLGGPIGAAIGAVLGGVGGFLSGSKAEKERRQAEELAKQQAEHARALKLANDKREQEIRLLELTGQASEALKLRREAELAAMDASLQANQLRIWALEDEADAAAKTADLQIRLMDAQGRASESLALKRTREIAAANDNERGMLRQIFAAEDVATARDALSAAYERESAALQATIDKFRAFADGLKRFRDQLYSGPAAMLSPEEQYRATKANFDRTAALAAGGNEDAIRDLESVSQAYLEASKAYYASSESYFQDLERVRAAVTATQAYAASQVSAAEAQLSALNASVAGILGVQGAVLSVKDALAAYNAAIQAQIAAANDNKTVTPGANDNTPAIPRAPDWSSYIKNNPDVAAEYARLSPNNLKNNLGVTSIEQFGQWHWQHYGQAEGRKPYATGGIIHRPMTIGEAGIVGEAGDEGILPLTNVGGRMGVHAVMPDMSEVVGELKSLRKEIDGLRKELVAANTQRGDMARDLGDRLDGVEDAVNRVEKRVAKAA